MFDLSAALYFFLRCAGVVLLFPLGESLLGLFRRMGILWLLGLWCGLVYSGPHRELNITAALTELSLGFMFGVPLAAAIAGLRCAVEAIENGRGQNIGALFDPTTDQQQSTVPAFAAHAAVTALVTVSLIEQILCAVGSSMQCAPLGSVHGQPVQDLAAVLFAWTAAVLTKLLLIAVPFLALCCLVECGFGALAVLVPSLSMQHEIVSLKQTLVLVAAYGILTYGGGFAGVENLVFAGLNMLVEHVGEAV